MIYRTDGGDITSELQKIIAEIPNMGHMALRQPGALELIWTISRRSPEWNLVLQAVRRLPIVLRGYGHQVILAKICETEDEWLGM